MKLKSNTFSGGFSFKNFEGKPNSKLVTLEAPLEILIPLKQGFGDELIPIVKINDRVKAGQILGINNNTISNPVHSSVNGVVEDISELDYSGVQIKTIKVKTEITSDFLHLDNYTSDWEKLDIETLEELIYLSGAASGGKEGIPTKYKSSDILSENVENIIIQGIESEPYNISVSRLLQNNRVEDFIIGVKILHAIMPKAKIHIAISKNEKDLLREIKVLLEDIDWVRVYAIMPKYPQEFEEIIISTILGKELEFDIPASKIGVLVLDIQEVLQVSDAVVLGKPVMTRIISLGGIGWKENLHIEVPIGTPIESIVSRFLHEQGKNRIIIDSLLTNEAISDLSLPLNRTVSSLIAIPENPNREKYIFLRPGTNRYSYSNAFLSSIFPKSEKLCNTNIHGEFRPCIFCGFCEDACPVDIIPHFIDKCVTNDLIDEKLINLGIFKCIECNLCSFVCPSKIPLANRIKGGKKELSTKMKIKGTL